MTDLIQAGVVLGPAMGNTQSQRRIDVYTPDASGVITKPVNNSIPGDAKPLRYDLMQNNLSIQITRQTRNIAAALPIPLFAPDAMSGDVYYSIITRSGLLPAGVTLTKIELYQNKYLRYTYTDGIVSDTVIVGTQAGNVSYPVIQQMLKNDIIISNQHQYTCGTGNTAAQIAAGPIAFGQFMINGYAGDNSEALDIFESEFQNRPQILRIIRRVVVNGRRYLIYMMTDAYAVAGDNVLSLSYKVNGYICNNDFEGPTWSQVAV